MIDPRVALAIIVAGLVYMGTVDLYHETVKVGNKVGHAVVHVLKHGVKK